MNKYKIILTTTFTIAFIWSGVYPPGSYPNWLLEISPILFSILVLIFTAKYIKISNFSYFLIILYLIFPLIAAHYGVTGVTFGETIGQWMGTTRNMYDRLTHFLFGFLTFYPLYEIVLQINKKENLWSYFVTFETMIALSAIYEIFEWLAAVTVNPTLAASFYGSQGDIFDTPKDMAMAVVGSMFAMLIIFLIKKYKKHETSN